MVKLSFVASATADRLADAAMNLMDAARAAATEAPTYKPGKSQDVEAISMAVQALFMSDFWDQGAGKKVALEPEVMLARFRGLGMGIGCSVAAMPSKPVQNVLVMAFLQAMSEAGGQREQMRKETGN